MLLGRSLPATFDREATPPSAAACLLLEDGTPGVGEKIGSLVPVHCPLLPFSDLDSLHDPPLVSVVLGADDLSILPVHNRIFYFAIISYG